MLKTSDHRHGSIARIVELSAAEPAATASHVQNLELRSQDTVTTERRARRVRAKEGFCALCIAVVYEALVTEERPEG